MEDTWDAQRFGNFQRNRVIEGTVGFRFGKKLWKASHSQQIIGGINMAFGQSLKDFSWECQWKNRITVFNKKSNRNIEIKCLASQPVRPWKCKVSAEESELPRRRTYMRVTVRKVIAACKIRSLYLSNSAKGGPGLESRTGSRLVSPARGREKKTTRRARHLPPALSYKR